MRILITGLGLVSGLGAGASATFARLLRGDSAIGPVSLFDTAGQRCKLGAQVQGLDVASIAPRGQAARWSRADALALVAAREALGQAGLDPVRDEVALALGGTMAGMFEAEGLLASMARDVGRCAPEPALGSVPIASTLDRLREALGPFRRARALCSACSAGSYAVALGAHWLRLGQARRVLVGATEGMCRMVFAGFDALMITDPDGCRPFDRRRRGINLGEGAAFLVLEADEAARERGAEPLAELAGWAVGAEAFHITQPEADGATVAGLIAAALRRAGADPSEVDFVSAHGTGTPRNDAAEAAALRAALGLGPRVSSHKGQLGHTLGVAGAAGAVLSVMAMREGVAPPTGGLVEPDPACELRHVLVAEPFAPRVALVNAFGFGGLDAVLALRAPGHAPSRPGSWEPPAGVVVASSATVSPAGLRRHDAPPADGPRAGQARWGEAALDPDRTRRLDRSSLAVIAACQEALRGAAYEAGGRRVGAVIGTMAGAIFTCAEHCARSDDAGGKCLNPILFPNLVSSSQPANAAIYLGLRGPVLSVVDRGISGEVAALTAIDWLRAGEADAVCAGAHDELSPLVAQAFDPLLLGLAPGATEAEGAAALLLERDDRCAERGGRPLARVVFHDEGAGEPPLFPAPRGAAAVFVARPFDGLDALLARRGWGQAPVLAASHRFGEHEAAGAQALALAAAALGRREVEQALVLGHGPGRWVALVLALPESP